MRVWQVVFGLLRAYSEVFVDYRAAVHDKMDLGSRHNHGAFKISAVSFEILSKERCDSVSKLRHLTFSNKITGCPFQRSCCLTARLFGFLLGG